jgi:hypothetical protein
MQQPVRKHLVTIQDASAEVQAWMDAFVDSARTGTGEWPHAHPVIPMSFVPLATFTHAMEQVGWGLTADGPVERNPTPGPVLSPVPEDPDKGSTYHNVLHSLLGNFH